jgi:hypothetical protein
MAPSACEEAAGRLSDRLFQEDVLVLSPFMVKKKNYKSALFCH